MWMQNGILLLKYHILDQDENNGKTEIRNKIVFVQNEPSKKALGNILKTLQT